LAELFLEHSWHKNIAGTDREWRVCLRDESEELSSLHVMVRRMRIGSAREKTGGISQLETAEAHRHRGYATRVLNSALERMVREKYAMCMLHGIKDFYHRFGFAPVMAESKMYVQPSDLLRARSDVPLRAMRATDGPAIARLHNRLNASRNCSHVRPGYWTHFEGLFAVMRGYPKPRKTVVSVDAAGRLRGYAAMSYRDVKEASETGEPTRYAVSEIEGRDPKVLESLASHIGRSARRAGIETVEFRLPYDHPFGQVGSLVGCRWEIEYPRNHRIVARITDLRSLFVGLEGELSRRAQDAGLGARRHRILFTTDIGDAGLRISGGAVQTMDSSERAEQTVEIPQAHLTQLVLGYRSAVSVCSMPVVRASASVTPVLSALFPLSPGYIWWSDRF
jgi:hypothetical protein